jgi:glucose-1-phosphate cytidylyltransferase
MKVVLFCGGQGMRIREYSSDVPKPMVPIGDRPILWHLMKYYAHFGHREFILCLGHKADVIKHYFLNYDECLTNDFTLSGGGRQVDLASSDIQDWTISFVDTGLHANVAERLAAVRPYLGDDERFLANYADGVMDLHLPDLIEYAERRGKVATFMAVRPPVTYHLVNYDHDGTVWDICGVQDTGMRINGGGFVLTQEVFDYIQPGEDLMNEPFARLVRAGQVDAFEFDGFWACMDTFKEKQHLDDIWTRGDAPWAVWKRPGHLSGDGLVSTPPALAAP